jgi:1-deoxy-D-xylulose-5-phosphate reductoisomerase
VLNAANEVAVAAFLAGAIPFPAVAAANTAVLESHVGRCGNGTIRDLADVLEADAWARSGAREWLAKVEGVRV